MKKKKRESIIVFFFSLSFPLYFHIFFRDTFLS